MFKYKKEHINYILKLRKKGVKFSQILKDFNKKFNVKKTKKSIERAFETHVSENVDTKAINSENIKDDIVATFCELVQKLGRIPRNSDMAKVGIRSKKIRHHFGSSEELYSIARKKKPKIFKDIVDENLFTDDRFTELNQKIKRYKRFVITTAVTGCDVNVKALASIKNYCKRNKALLLVLPCSDPAKVSKISKWQLDSRLAKEAIVFKDLWLNTNVLVSTIKVAAKQIKPLTGLHRLSQKTGTFIYSSPKQFLEFVPVGDNQKPKCLITTGAITDPDYETDKYMSERTAYISQNDHKLGAFIVEIKDSKRFFIRNIEIDESGCFVDVDRKYKPDGTIKQGSLTELVAVADYHVQETDPNVKAVIKDIVHRTTPKFVTYEDFFNGTSINHHETNKIVTLAKKAEAGGLILKNELAENVEELKEICQYPCKHVIMKRANHEAFLVHWLQDSEYLNQPHNYALGLKLASAMVEGSDPYQHAIEHVFGFRNKKLRFLKKDELFKVGGIENSCHGHLGPNGKRGASLEALERSFGRCNSAHTHSPAIFRGVYRNGTSSYLKLSYCEGSSSWANSIILQHFGGTRQLVIIIDGEYTL
jgi:hypothetical protein